MKKTVAIIGAGGKVGSVLALRLAVGGYRVLLTDEIDKHPVLYARLPLLRWKIRLALPDAEAEVVSSEREASWEADLIILTIRHEVQAGVARKIHDVVTGKIVLDIVCASCKRGDGLVTPSPTSAAEELARILPHSKIVSASFLTIAPGSKAPQTAPEQMDVFVAGDDEEAISTVKQLIKDAGFNPLSAGKLVKSRVLESLLTLLMGFHA